MSDYIFDSWSFYLSRKCSLTPFYTVTIFTERAACSSCLGVAEQFKAKYPNIQVNILDNNGVVMRPPKGN
ncbi:hypothetical protein DXK93_02325 [Achromobacter sp. K91]|uniref:deaminase domain-containing protein n=1 Tax=Achromobacter TaxID=222 RepID=UPI000E6700BB|nr:hypothetical protein [Achromobacter sp. ACM02]MBD9429906.1 hypothetical protein [Achromobacter sp. ACM03]RIJ05602.1 hypothetical protein DXK93_02325 [Achromobacter sp. K91]